MKYIKGDLLEGDWDVAIHCANVHCVMGSGVAYFLKKKWPEVFEADLEFMADFDSGCKLGNFSRAIVDDGRWVYNLYGQVGVGNDGHPLNRNCQYDHLYNALYKSCTYMTNFTDSSNPVRVGVPYGMAACRAGGSWLIIDAMLADMEDKFPVSFIVYDIDNGEMNAQSSVTIPK